MEFERRRHDADFIEPVSVEAHILGVNVEQLVGEIAHRLEIVHVLPDHVRGIVVEAEVIAGNVGEHAPPYLRRMGQVLAARPFVLREGHGAVLDADLDVAVLGKADKRRPDFEEAGPVVIDRFGPVAADEAVHDTDAEQVGGRDHLFDVVDAGLGLVGVGGQRVGIVAERADGDAGGGDEGIDFVGVGLGEADDVDVGDAGVAALRLARGPAHQLDGGKAIGRGELDDLFQREVG